MKGKKIFTLGLVALLSLGTLATTASAADYKDKAFSFYVDKKTKETESYTKYEKSSVYIHITEGSLDYARVQAYGYINGKWQNKTVGTTAFVPVGPDKSAKSRIRTTIIESTNGAATSVKLKFPKNEYASIVGGVWSPDCAGNYPAVN